jgi:hypothetical protein
VGTAGVCRPPHHLKQIFNLPRTPLTVVRDSKKG